MNKQQISRRKYDTFVRQLVKHQNEGRISHDQMVEILKTYDVEEGISFIRVLVTVGSILIGLAFLTFIASNWIYIGKAIKLLLIIFSYLFVSTVSYQIQEKYPKTSHSLIYLGILIFGAGIFLIGQMFHFGGRFTDAFLLWAIGILPITIFFKDKWSFAFLHVLILAYLNGHYVYDKLPIYLIIIIPVLYILQWKLFTEKWILFFTNIISLNFIWFLLDEGLYLDTELILIIFFVIGLLMYFVPISFQSKLFQLQGNIIFGITGLILTVDAVWDYFWFIEKYHIPMHVIFAVLYTFLLLYLVRHENLLSLIFIGLVILRFYFDTMYDFLPKSILFLIGGVLLLGFGYYFERKRQKIWGRK